jgi:subtilisin
MDVINLSIQGPHAQSLQDVCDLAYNSGVLVVAAGGNTNGGSVRYPGAYESVIAVTGTDDSDRKAYFSPVGPEVEVAAPGVSILSTCSQTTQSCDDSGGSYSVLSGTSQAAPHVTGTAVLFLNSDLQDMNGDGTINHEDVRQALQATATDLGAPGQDTTFGFGLVNAAEAASPAHEPLSITLVRTSGPPAAQDAETVALSGGLYEITINNNGLSKVRFDVFEDGVFQQDLSSSFRFHRHGKKHRGGKRIHGHKKSQGETISLDATGKNYEVTFTPYGKSGKSADIGITMQ